MTPIVAQARETAEAFLADALPRRWAHTIGVAATAERLAAALEPVHADTIIAAAWLHDIGYAPDLADGFHPIDGAAYVSRTCPDLWTTVNLIAHHSGAVFEARERGLETELASYRFPVDVEELAILNAADLCTSPDGEPIDPLARLNEVLDRYPPEHPVHRAIARSGSILLAQARLVLGAAEAAQYRQRRVGVPESVKSVEPGPLGRRYRPGITAASSLRHGERRRPPGPASSRSNSTGNLPVNGNLMPSTSSTVMCARPWRPPRGQN